MRIPGILLLFGLSLPLASAALAEGLCYKQSLVGPPVVEGARSCRLNTIFDGWLSENGFELEPLISVNQRVGAISSSQAASRLFLEPASNRPWARVEVAYWLGKSDSLAASRAIRLHPGLFGDLESVLKKQAKAILCETIGEDEKAFVSAGGAILYEVGLRPRFRDSETPDWFVKVEIPQSSCEVT